MTDTEKEYIILRPAENSPWGKFLYATINLDIEHGKPSGWHWLLAIYRLADKFPNTDSNKIGHSIPCKDSDGDEIQIFVPTKKPDEPHYFDTILYNLLTEIGRPDEISKIDFSKLDFTEDSVFTKDFTFLNFIFPVEVSFTGTNFANNINFTNTKFLKHADFTNTKFLKHADFTKAKFFEHADFTNAKFFNTITFSDTTFCTVNFSNASFSKNVTYSRAVFSEKATFNRAVFSNGAQFYEAQFFGEAIFTNTVFYKGKFLTSFNKAVFSEIVRFDNAEIEGKLYFLETTFSKNAIFSNVTFSRLASFQNSTFSDRSTFKKATFLQSVNFTNVTFSNVVVFTQTVFSNSVNFTNSKFFNNVTFEYAFFNNKVFFDITRITKPIDFTNAHFKVYVPSFYDANICPDIIWDNAEWPNPAQFKYAKNSKQIQYNKNAYENLANHMEKLDKYHDKHFFFRQEMRCRRRLGKNMFIRFPYAVYEWLADYGYGAGRAILWWVAHILGSAGILSSIRYFNHPSVSLDDFGCSVGISLSNSHAFFFKGSHLKHCYESFGDLPWFNVIWGFQTIMGTILIFLVLLTLRIRFKL